MRNRILDDLNRKDLTAQAENAIKTAISFYEKDRFWFLEQRSTTTTVNAQEYYPVPDNYLDLDSLVIEVNNYAYPLNKRSYGTLEAWHVKQSVFLGYPSDYAIYATGEQTQIRLYPVPNGSYQLTLSYFGSLDVLEAESDTNSWLTIGEELVRSRAEWTLYAQKLRDVDAAQMTKVIETEALSQLERLTKMRQFTGRTEKRGGYRWR